MAARDTQKGQHHGIFQYLKEEMTADDFIDFKNLARTYLPGAKVEKCENAFALCCELERVGQIKPGDYAVLTDILKNANLISFKDGVEARAQEIGTIKLENLVTAVQPDSANFPNPPASHEEPSESRRSVIPVTETFVSVGQPESSNFPNPPAFREEPRKFHPSADCQAFSDKILNEISKIIQNSDACVRWKNLGRELGMKEADFNEISYDNRRELGELCHQMLLKWYNRNGSEANVSHLKIALENIGFKKVSEEIEKLLQRNK